MKLNSFVFPVILFLMMLWGVDTVTDGQVSKDFDNVQNLLLGEALYDLNKDTYEADTHDR